jgi:hypothetical protein
MKNAIRWAAAGTAGLLALSQAAAAADNLQAASARTLAGEGVMLNVAVPKAASAQTLGARAVVTPTATFFGGFQLTQAAVVYILIRGNSLGSLGITNNFLDAPRVRLFNSAGQDIINDASGRPGFNACVPPPAGQTEDFTTPVINYYQNTRGEPVHPRDGCFAGTFAAGVYTFSVTPSIPGQTTTTGQSVPSSGEVLVEATLGP